MTASKPSARLSLSISGTVILNLLLACVCAGGLAYCLSGANSVAASEYQILALRSQIGRLNEQQSTLTAEKSATEDPAAAALFAQSHNMVEAKDITYMFENGNVALQR